MNLSQVTIISSSLLLSLPPIYRYAKVSKRVNIQRLKADIWGNIRATLPNVDPNTTAAAQENAPAAPAPTLNKTSSATAEGMSFQTMIADLAAGDEARQRDVTLPFYFICLLHLANEHVSGVEIHVEQWSSALCLVVVSNAYFLVCTYSVCRT